MSQFEPTPDEYGMRAKLAMKLLAIMGEVERIEKDGFNTGQKFKFASEAAFIEAVRPAFIKHQVTPPAPIFVHYHDKQTTVSKAGSESITLLASVGYEVVDAETGMAKQLEVLAAGNDQLDKHAFKLMTGALKYAIKQLLLLPTGDDPENDGGRRSTPARQPNAALSNPRPDSPSRATASTQPQAAASVTPAVYQQTLTGNGITVEAAKLALGVTGSLMATYPDPADVVLAVKAREMLDAKA